MEIELVNFITKHSTILSFIFGFLLLAVNYLSSEQAQRFQDKSIASQEEAKNFQNDSLHYQKQAKDAQDKNSKLIQELLDNASNPDLLSEKLLELRTEWLNKMSENSSPINPDIDHIISAVNEIEREKEEVELTREENISTALRQHELLANPIWTKISDIFYQKALLLEKEGILKDVEKHTLSVDKKAKEAFFGQTHDFKYLVSATVVKSGRELKLMFSRELYPLSKDPKSKFGSMSSFITTKQENQIVLNVSQKKFRISSPKSELIISTSELAEKMTEINRIATETFDDYLIQELSQ